MQISPTIPTIAAASNSKKAPTPPQAIQASQLLLLKSVEQAAQEAGFNLWISASTIRKAYPELKGYSAERLERYLLDSGQAVASRDGGRVFLFDYGLLMNRPEDVRAFNPTAFIKSVFDPETGIEHGIASTL